MKTSLLTLLFISSFSLCSFADTHSPSFFGGNTIVMKSFSGSVDRGVIKLSWDLTEMEQEVSCFLERSEDGVSFFPFQRFEIKKRFAGVMNAYDKIKNGGLYYYRIKMTKTGYLSYVSTVVSVRNSAGKEINSPFKIENPFRHQLTINGNFGAQKIVVEIADMNGQVRIVKNIKANSAMESASIACENLDKGVYIIRVKEEINGIQKLITTKRVIKNSE
ncbi:MAG: T9SS type A sorting domain-containing protein [Chitinophagaceae bacterium]